MRITERKVDLVIPRDDHRSPGLHCSEVIRYLALRFGHLKREYEDEELDPYVICPGLAWEDWILKYHHTEEDILYHPGEVERDGISMSADGISFHATKHGMSRVHEFKYTFKSARRSIDQDWMYLTQLKAYCLGWETVYATLHVFYAMGDYKRTPGYEKYKVFDIEFTPTELAENWEMILQGAAAMRRQGKTKTAGPAVSKGKKLGKK